MAATISRDDAVQFLRRCGIENLDKLLESDRFQLLQRIPRVLLENLPFQNMHASSVIPTERRKLDKQAIVKNMLNFQGGTCMDLNGFAVELLTAIGFHASLLPCGIDSESVNHVLVLIEDVQREGDKYLLDVGFGHPSFRVVPLDFEVESETFTDSVLTYKFIKAESGRYYRMHLRARETPRPFTRCTEDGWLYAFWFTLERHTYEWLTSEIERTVFTNPHSTLMNSYRICGFSKSRFVAVYNYRIYEEVEPGKLEKVETDKDSVLAFVDLHFPNLDKQVSRDAFDNWLTYGAKN